MCELARQEVGKVRITQSGREALPAEGRGVDAAKALPFLNMLVSGERAPGVSGDACRPHCRQIDDR